ncbi:hypothetical protein [Nevskia soli]|jgi:hypothetical protein|uniref:hypothetical protein n=1 Tax=Nevskia soli TaxID=418856 RepID=UPI0015D6F150|nr:hypothetical protein [Nevskia soli]
MRTLQNLLIVAGGLALLAQGTALADTPGHHPHYLHARGDLQEARALLRGPMPPNVQADLQAADHEIEGAIQELNRAAWADAKDVMSRAHPDSHPDPVGRFRNLMKLLTRARKDLAAEEDNPAAMGWRDGAYRHIDAAISFVRRGATDAHYDRQLGW